MEPLIDINAILNELSPFSYILQFLGFFYNVSPDAIKNLRQFNFRFFDFGLICILSNILVKALYLVVLGDLIIQIYLDFRYPSLVDKLVNIFIVIGLQYLPCFINWIMSITNSKKFIAILIKISKLDADCGWWTPGARPKTKKTKIFVMIWLIVIIIQTILATHTTTKINLYIVYYMASVVYFLTFIKIGSVMELILFRMKLQNTQIVLLESSLGQKADPVGAGEMKKMFNSHRNYHLKLITIIKQLNSVQSIEIIMNMVLNFFTLYFFSFYAMLFLYHPGGENFNVRFNVFLDFIFAASLALINMMYICNTAHGLIQEVKRTPRLVSKLAIYTSDEDVLDELKRFSIQLALTPVKITACGLFELDNSTILSIFNTLATNIVIMLQVAIINKDRN